MEANIRYRVLDGEILEASFGSVGVAGAGEAIIQVDGFIPDFDEYYVSEGKLAQRTQQDIDDRQAENAALDRELALARLSAQLTAAKAQNLTRADAYLTAKINELSS